MIEVLAVLHYSLPIALAALGETVTQKSGVLQIGLEGLLLTAGFGAAVSASATGNPWLGLAMGIALGVLFSTVSAFFCLKLRGDQVVVGTALNLLALGLTATLYRSWFPAGMERIPRMASSDRFDPVMGLAFVFVIALGFALYRTGWGLLVRSAGENPNAVEASGFRVDRIRFGAMLIGGAIGGLAGAYLSVGIVGDFAENMTGGRGFIAIAMVTFGRWQPWGAIAASILVGLTDSLQFTLQARGISAPFQLMVALPYILSLAVLVLAGKSVSGPASLGLPYRRHS